MHEGERRFSEPTPPIPLPEELVEFLKTQEYACLMQATSMGTAHVFKAPAAEIARLRGPIPIHVQHELYRLPQAPVIRSLIRFHDNPPSALSFETFTNIADPDQAADFTRLARQRDLIFLFYDEQVRHRLSKLVPQHEERAIRRIATWASDLAMNVPADLYDFDAARTVVVERTRL